MICDVDYSDSFTYDAQLILDPPRPLTPRLRLACGCCVADRRATRGGNRWQGGRQEAYRGRDAATDVREHCAVPRDDAGHGGVLRATCGASECTRGAGSYEAARGEARKERDA